VIQTYVLYKPKVASPRPRSRTTSTATNVSSSDDINGNRDVQRIISILRPLWTILPSPEARAANIGNTNQESRRTSLPTLAGSHSPGPVSSLSESDVRSFNDATLQSPTFSPKLDNNSNNGNNGTFTIEAFAGQVMALINDDRALIERLVKLSQTHDLLKQNVDKAEKLAREGAVASDGYQKQVKTLEARNMGMVVKQVA